MDKEVPISGAPLGTSADNGAFTRNANLYKIWSDDANFVGLTKIEAHDFLTSDRILRICINSPLMLLHLNGHNQNKRQPG
jgi:hypothetical protein